MTKVNRMHRRTVGTFEISPFESNEFQAHVVAVCNRVFLRCGDYAFFSHVELAFFIASSFQRKVITSFSIHRANSNFLLAFSFLLHGVQEFLLCPRWKDLVSIGNFSADVECPKGWQVTPLWVSVVGPVCRSDLAFQEYLL